MSDLDGSAAVPTAQAAETDPRQLVADLGDMPLPGEFHSWTLATLLSVLPDVVAFACAQLLVPACVTLLRPQVEVVDRFPGLNKEAERLRHFPQALSTQLQTFLPPLLAQQLLGEMIVRANASPAKPGTMTGGVTVEELQEAQKLFTDRGATSGAAPAAEAPSGPAAADPASATPIVGTETQP